VSWGRICSLILSAKAKSTASPISASIESFTALKLSRSMSRIPQCKPMNAAMTAVLTGPVKKGEKSRKGPKASSRSVSAVSAVTSAGNPSKTSPSGRAT
jgi:hypothetical protein